MNRGKQGRTEAVKTVLGYVVKDAEIQSAEPVDSAAKVMPFLEDYRLRDRKPRERVAKGICHDCLPPENREC